MLRRASRSQHLMVVIGPVCLAALVSSAAAQLPPKAPRSPALSGDVHQASTIIEGLLKRPASAQVLSVLKRVNPGRCRVTREGGAYRLSTDINAPHAYAAMRADPSLFGSLSVSITQPKNPGVGAWTHIYQLRDASGWRKSWRLTDLPNGNRLEASQRSYRVYDKAGKEVARGQIRSLAQLDARFIRSAFGMDRQALAQLFRP